MPANPKYLETSPWQKFAKISSGIVGGYMVTALFHMNLALWMPNSKEVLITSVYTFFILWGTLLIVPFLFKSGWKAWLLYLLVSSVLFGFYYLGNLHNPFV